MNSDQFDGKCMKLIVHSKVHPSFHGKVGPHWHDLTRVTHAQHRLRVRHSLLP